MRPPTRVQVGARNYDIRVDAQLAQVHDALGVHLGRYSEIVLSPNQGSGTMRESFLHELLHACIFDLDGGNCEWIKEDDEEKIVAVLAPRLLDMLRRNPKVVDFILTKD